MTTAFRPIRLPDRGAYQRASSQTENFVAVELPLRT